MLRASVTAGKSGPVIVLSGEADITSVEQLNAVLTGQLASGARYVTIDASGLRFADSMAIHALLAAAQTLKERGGGLILLRPQDPVARILSLIGVDQLITIRGISRGHGRTGSGAEQS